MQRPKRKEFTKPFNYAKALEEYIEHLHKEINVAFDYLHNSDIMTDNQDQCYQILQGLIENQ